MIVPGDNNTIEHSQLTLGNIMIMVSSEQRKSEFVIKMKTPAETGNFVTQSPYLVLNDRDLEEHYKNAKKAWRNYPLGT